MTRVIWREIAIALIDRVVVRVGHRKDVYR